MAAERRSNGRPLSVALGGEVRQPLKRRYRASPPLSATPIVLLVGELAGAVQSNDYPFSEQERGLRRLARWRTYGNCTVEVRFGSI